MSMLCSFWRVPPDKWDALLAGLVLPEETEQGTVWKAAPREPEPEGESTAPAEAYDSEANKALFKQLGALLGEPETESEETPGVDEAQEEEPPGEPAEVLWVDKAWHALHFLLTETDWGGRPPLNFIVSGGEELEDADCGYGPARAFSRDAVRTIASALQKTSLEDLETRFAPSKMSALQIYPSVWDRPDADQRLVDLLGHFQELRSFVIQSAEVGAGLVVQLS